MGRPSKKGLWTPTSGPLAGLKQLDRADSAPEVYSKPVNAEPHVSYQDCKGPNRFWGYIGPTHIAKHRHLYPQHVLEKFVPSVAAEPVELDAGDTEIKRMAFSELPDHSDHPKRASVHHEVHSNPLPVFPQRERKDSARDLSDISSVTEAVIGDYTIKLPPAFPPKKRGFDPGELEEAIKAAFG
ncbi:hypothetical protein LTR37_004734 [Vermiconidia calcicola]|uniref:Uncharacterized protein n=1 Tax=Vermiconidia calcicola TaxID=1690605 RepID=A0ACC3NMM4_9PEZI|nr:hypothetical protein LTR37_004734 [Vermiconidia calcicola]